MPVTGWRRPAWAPVYALVTAFLVVVGISLLAAGQSTVLRLTAGQGDLTQLADVPVEVRDKDGRTVSAGKLSQQGTYQLDDDAEGGTVCVGLPRQWRATDAAVTGQCTTWRLPERAAAELPLSVVRQGVVIVRFKDVGDPVALLERTTITVRQDKKFEFGQPDETGIYVPRVPLSGRTVCVAPPADWNDPKAGALDQNRDQCAPPTTDPGADVVFTLEKSP